MATDLSKSYYNIVIRRMKRGNARGVVINAKPIFLLSILSLIAEEIVIDNRFRFNEMLNNSYNETCEKYNQPITPLYKPFYHLSSDGFWYIKWKENAIEKKTPSAKFIRDNIEYAYLDNALWDLLQIEDVREEYKNTIINFYLN